MAVSSYNGIGGARTRGAFWPSRGLPTTAEMLVLHREATIRVGDAFVARDADDISGVVNMPGPGFAVGDRIVFTGTDAAAATSWTWFPAVTPIPAGTPVVVLSEDDNSN